MTLQEMKQKYDDDSVRAIEKLFIKTVIDGLKTDAVRSAEFILSRTVGKAKEEIEIDAKVDDKSKLKDEVIAHALSLIKAKSSA